MSCSSGRIARLRAVCAEAGIDAFLVRDTSGIRWLTGFDGVFDEERAHALLLTRDGAVLHTDSRYAEAMRRAAHALGDEVAVDDGRVASSGRSRGRLPKRARGHRCARRTASSRGCAR